MSNLLSSVAIVTLNFSFSHVSSFCLNPTMHKLKKTWCFQKLRCLLFDLLTAAKPKKQVSSLHGTKYREHISILEASVPLSDVIEFGKEVQSSWE